MKKKILIMFMLVVGLLSLTACKKNEINLHNHLIEDRQNLFVATDNNYTVTLSSGLRESNYCFDGIVGEKTNFAILSLFRNDGKNLAKDTYSYTVTIGEENITGFLEKSEIDNSYSVDLQVAIPTESIIKAQISFTGYSFNQELQNISCQFNVDNNTAISIANEQLKSNIENIVNSNSNIEVVTKILCDNSASDISNYYWYVGVIATSGDTLGILIDANSGEILAKKV